MTHALAYAEAPLSKLVAVLNKKLHRPVRVQWSYSAQGDRCAWVEVQGGRSGAFARAASLTIELHGPTAKYLVAAAPQGDPTKFPALATALRELQQTVIKAATQSPKAQQQEPLSEAQPTFRTPPDGATSALPEPPGYRTTYTADQAAGQPVIRAAVIVGHEVFRAKGTTPPPADLLALANKALDVIDLLVPPDRQEVATDAWVEKALIGMLTGALLAV